MDDFFSLIDALNNSQPKDKAALETELWQKYGYQKAVLALDMSGFSLTVRRDGIVAYLAKIRQMQQLTMPLIAQFHGELVKCVADNIMVVFADCQQAINASIAMSRACKNIGQSVSIGLDYGHILLIKHEDCYGDAVNKAYKLGEDIARADEILITKEIKDQLPVNHGYTLTTEHISVSGLVFLAYKVC